ncbi:PREDICTED: uncharacterized protein LOC109587232, partial [Amphimedon queenslandica]|uniref:Uncharacterized protein n=1 Tax=Amphimedon queenslandica TaxID=400682 RepID=A0AAN0JQD8_AMPQE
MENAYCKGLNVLEKLSHPDIRIRPKAQVNELKFHGHFCCGPSLEAIVTPWCPLIPQDAPPPHSVPYMQMHLMKESRSDTIDGIYQIYKDRDKLEVLFIIAREEQQQPFSPPDLRFRIIFISRRHKKDVLELAEKGHDLEVTVNITESKNEVMRALMPQESENFATLIKVVHYVIQNRVTVSLSSGISEYPNICPEDKRVLSCFLDFLCYQSLENHIDVQLAVSSSVNCIFNLLHQPIHFDYMFPKDFIFYFDLAYTNYRNESVEKNAHKVMIHYLHKLKKVPIETVAEQVEHFVKLGDFKADISSAVNLSSVFEHTAKAFLKHCELYFKRGEISEAFHVTLLLISIGVKINSFSDKKLAKYDHIWNKKFNEYYKSGFSQNHLLCLEKGLKAMTTILEGFPHLMSEWKDLYLILSSKVYTFETMKEFITQSVKYLIRSRQDSSFRIDFLQPLTDMCLNASRKKKIASHFSVDANNVIKEGKEFLACLILLIDEQKWSGYDYYTILENWMKIIFNLIDLSEESHKFQLFQWIHEEQINSSYFDYDYSFNKELEDFLLRSQNLSAELLISIVNSVSSERFDKAKTISDFLGKSGVHKSLLDEPNCHLIILAVA